MKLKLSLLFVLILFPIFITTTKAEINKLDVKEEITLNNTEADIAYTLNIHNNSSEELISKIELFIPYDNYEVSSVNGAKVFRVKDKTITIDLFQQPINVRSSKTIVIGIKVNEFVEEWGGFKRIVLKRFTADYEISSFSLILKYPKDWMNPYYSSFEPQVNEGILTYKENKDIYVVWGGQTHLSYVFSLKVEGDNPNLLPIIRDTHSQEVTLRSFENINDIYLDGDNNIFVVPTNGVPVTLKGSVEVNSIAKSKLLEPALTKTEKHDFPKLDSSEKDGKIKEIAQKLKTENIKDEWEANIKFVQWARSESIPSFVNVGWNLGLNRKTGSYSYWISWYDGQNWNDFDLSAYMNSNTSNVNKVNPERIVVIEVVNFDKDMLANYTSLVHKQMTPGINLTSKSANEGEVILNVFFDKDSQNLNKIKGKLNVENRTNRVLDLEAFRVNGKKIEISNIQEGLRRGILPGQYKVFDFSYYMKFSDLFKDPLALVYEITYQIANGQSSYGGTDQVNNWEGSLNSLHFIFIGLVTSVFFLVWTTIVVISKEFHPFRNLKIFGKL